MRSLKPGCWSDLAPDLEMLPAAGGSGVYQSLLLLRSEWYGCWHIDSSGQFVGIYLVD